MFEKYTDHVEVLPAADGTTWLARRQGNSDLLVLDISGDREGFRVEGACNRWTATVDHAGIPWVIMCEDETVFARRYQDGAWGPRLQVSTRPDMATDPFVVADEYANVWVFWRYVHAAELWVCRMGPRSGQETLVARANAPRLLRVATLEGRLYALYEERGGRTMLVSGTEHGGFGEPERMPATSQFEIP